MKSNVYDTVESHVRARGDDNNKEPRFPTPRRGIPFDPPSTTSALFTDGSNTSQQGLWCTYCKDAHPSFNCNVVINISARKQFLRQKRKCFSCMCTENLASQCENGKGCHRGSLRHHASICENQGLSHQIHLFTFTY